MANVNEYNERRFRLKKCVKFKAKELIPRRSEILELMHASNLGKDPLKAAVSDNNVELVKHLLVNGSDANASDWTLRSPLHIAVSKCNTAIVRVLLEYGAKVDEKDLLENTPLHLAACTSNIEIITLLIDAGADINAKDRKNRSPLQLAKSRLDLIKQKPRDSLNNQELLRSDIMKITDIMVLLWERRNQSSENKLEMGEDEGEMNKMMEELQQFSIN